MECEHGILFSNRKVQLQTQPYSIPGLTLVKPRVQHGSHHTCTCSGLITQGINLEPPDLEFPQKGASGATHIVHFGPHPICATEPPNYAQIIKWTRSIWYGPLPLFNHTRDT